MIRSTVPCLLVSGRCDFYPFTSVFGRAESGPGVPPDSAVISVGHCSPLTPTRDFLTLAVTGFALFLAPWVAGFSEDNAAWTAWVSGALATAFGVAGYLRGEHLDSQPRFARMPTPSMRNGIGDALSAWDTLGTTGRPAGAPRGSRSPTTTALTFNNFGGRGRYRTADHWCVPVASCQDAREGGFVAHVSVRAC